MPTPHTPATPPPPDASTRDISSSKLIPYAALGFLVFVCLFLAVISGVVLFGDIPVKKLCSIQNFLNILVPICLAAGGAFLGGFAHLKLDLPILDGFPVKGFGAIGGSFVFFIIGFSLMTNLPRPAGCAASFETGSLSFMTKDETLSLNPSANIWIKEAERVDGQRMFHVRPEARSDTTTTVTFKWNAPVKDTTTADAAMTVAHSSETVESIKCPIKLHHYANFSETPDFEEQKYRYQRGRSKPKGNRIEFKLNTSVQGCEGFLSIDGLGQGSKVLANIHYPVTSDKIMLFVDPCFKADAPQECALTDSSTAALDLHSVTTAGFWPFTAAYANEYVTFEMALERLNSEDATQIAETRQQLGARFSETEIVKRTFEELAKSDTAPDVKSGLLHAVIEGIQLDPEWSNLREIPLDQPLPNFDEDKTALTYQLLADDDTGVRRQARRLIQRYPVDTFQPAIDSVVAEANAGNCTALHGSGELVYAAIFYRYNRLIRSAMDDANSVDIAAWQAIEEDTQSAALECLTENSAIDAAILTYGRALAEDWKNTEEGEAAAKEAAKEFLDSLGDNRDSYYKPRHVAQMLALAGLEVDDQGDLVPAQ